MVSIQHLSVAVQNPENAARALAEITNGTAQPFMSKNMPGAWMCIWNSKTNHLIEFLPRGYVMYETDYGADFKKIETAQSNSTHFQLEVTTPVSEIQAMAERYGFRHKFRPSRGGPLYDVWFESDFVVELVSDEIRSMG